MDAAEALTPEQEPAHDGLTGREQEIRDGRTGREPDIHDGLTSREQEILAFERQWWKYAGAKERAIRELFDMSATRYYQLLNGLLDKQEALRVDPMLIKRLRRSRATRARSRAARRLGIEPR